MHIYIQAEYKKVRRKCENSSILNAFSFFKLRLWFRKSFRYIQGNPGDLIFMSIRLVRPSLQPWLVSCIMRVFSVFVSFLGADVPSHCHSQLARGAECTRGYSQKLSTAALRNISSGWRTQHLSSIVSSTRFPEKYSKSFETAQQQQKKNKYPQLPVFAQHLFALKCKEKMCKVTIITIATNHRTNKLGEQ